MTHNITTTLILLVIHVQQKKKSSRQSMDSSRPLRMNSGIWPSPFGPLGPLGPISCEVEPLLSRIVQTHPPNTLSPVHSFSQDHSVSARHLTNLDIFDYNNLTLVKVDSRGSYKNNKVQILHTLLLAHTWFISTRRLHDCYIVSVGKLRKVVEYAVWPSYKHFCWSIPLVLDTWDNLLFIHSVWICFCLWLLLLSNKI